MVFDENWHIEKTIIFATPRYLIQVGNSFYVSNQNNLHRTDKNLGVIHKIPGVYGTLHFNEAIFAVNLERNSIDMFDFELKSLGSIILTNKPYGITSYGKNIFISTENKTVNIVNEQSEGNMEIKLNQCDNSIPFIHAQCNGIIIAACKNTFQLYFPNGTYINKIETNSEDISYFSYDLNGQLIFISKNHIFVVEY